jgi:hypothetical protein|tara:strand:- start:2494 stop:3294 length:801 start_codon:yes stop_codon:yes gene_type:complete
MTKNKEVAVQAKTTNIIDPKSLASDSVFEAMAGEGLENVTTRDLIVPRLTILQALSPQVQPKKPEYIHGAKVGDICDVGTQEIFEGPLQFLPVHYVKQYLEWAPRSSGKGLVKIHEDASILDRCKPDEKNRPTTPDGNYIAETAQFFGLNLQAGGRRCFLPMASTQLKKARRWLTLATSEKVARENGSSFTPPLFYRVYNLSAVDESNSEGDWTGWKIERSDRLQDLEGNWREYYDEAISFRDSLKRGEARGDISVDEEVSGEASM